MAITELAAAPLCEVDHRTRLRSAVIAGSIGTASQTL